MEALTGNRVSSEHMSYKKDRQPPYKDKEDLDKSEALLGMIDGATKVEHVAHLRGEFARIGSGKLTRPIVVVRPCVGDIPADGNIQPVVEGLSLMIDTVHLNIAGKPLIITGNGSEKPRSEPVESGPNGQKIVSYMGDAVNGVDVDDREPDPERMVVAAMQAHDVHYAIDHINGDVHVPSTQEVLLLPSIRGMMRDTSNNGKYLASTDLPWIGERTRDPNGEHVELLRHIRNPVGIKIGPSTASEDIKSLSRKLNLQNEPGKLVFILRIGLDSIEKAPTIMDAIAKHAPGSILLCDPMHGNTTKLDNGMKTRCVKDIVDEIGLIAEFAQASGLKLHGLHLEAKDMGDEKECIDQEGELPTRKSKIDPQLNISQLAEVLSLTERYLHP